MVCAERAIEGLALTDRLGLTRARAPRARRPARGRAEPVPPPRRVRAHAGGAREADRAQGELESASARRTRRRLRALLDEPLADELTRGEALRFGALLPRHRQAATRAGCCPDGRVTFIGHDTHGAQMMRRPRAAPADERPRARLPRRARHATTSRSASSCTTARSRARAVYRYLDLTDAGGGRGHAALVRRPARHPRAQRGRRHRLPPRARAASCWATRSTGARSGPPALPMRGDELARELGIEPGPELGRLIGGCARPLRRRGGRRRPDGVGRAAAAGQSRADDDRRLRRLRAAGAAARARSRSRTPTSVPPGRRASCGSACSSRARRSSSAVTAEFHLHELAVEDALNAHQRPKLEVYGETFFAVLKTVPLHRPRGGDRVRRDHAVRRQRVPDLGPPRRGLEPATASARGSRPRRS